MATDFISGMLILRMITKRLIRKSSRANNVPLALKISMVRLVPRPPELRARDPMPRPSTKSVPTKAPRSRFNQKVGPQAGSELAPILSEEAPAENRLAPGRSGAGPARVRNVSLSKRLTPRGNKEKATLWTPNPRNKNLKLCRQRL